MSQLDDAITRYHKILETAPFRDMDWAKSLQERMIQERLAVGGRLLCPFLRPNFVTQRQYDAMVKTGEALISAVERMQQIVLRTPNLLAKLHLLPAEKMLAAVDPGYHATAVSSQLDLNLHNGTLQITDVAAESPAALAVSDALAALFFDCPPVKELRRNYKLTAVGGNAAFLNALLQAYEQTGKKQKPRIAILEFRTSTGGSEFEIVRDFFRSEGYEAEIVSPEQLEYRNGVLRSGRFQIDLAYRRFGVQEFLTRFDLSHPLVHAYRDRAVCLVNSFRAELGRKRAMFAFLTDETLTAKFPAAERKALRDHVPLTRLVAAGSVTWKGEQVDLLEFIHQNREEFVLKPNDDASDEPTIAGTDYDQAGWERAVRQAQRSPYVVQEAVEPARYVFPMLTYGHLEYREMHVDVHPQAFLGKVAACPTVLSAAGGYSSAAGITPTFIISDSKS